VISSPAIADLTGDGQSEVVMGSCDKNVYCLNVKDGQVKWRYETGDYVVSSSVVTDLEGDGKQEIIVGSLDNRVYCLGLVSVSVGTQSSQGAIKIVIVVTIVETVVAILAVTTAMIRRRKRNQLTKDSHRRTRCFSLRTFFLAHHGTDSEEIGV